ncbi:MAG: type II secretion system protein N [Steroidobacteraceae bacterium]|nr:type II secretion system protein N [Steroidobacteraceae bacterium]
MAAAPRFSWRLATVAVVVVIATVAARWPLAWTTRWLPDSVQCGVPAGSLWHGRCGALTIAGLPLGDTSWQVRLLPLLRGTLAATLVSRQGADQFSADLEWRPDGRRILRNVDAELTLGAGLLSRSAFGLAGRAQVRLGRVVLRDRRVLDLAGLVSVRRLAQGNTPLGDYEVRFPEVPPAGNGTKAPAGQLRDIGGPLGVTGTITLTDEPGYVVAGMVTTRADTAPALAAQIAYLGTPDAQGRRPFSLAGTY